MCRAAGWSPFFSKDGDRGLELFNLYLFGVHVWVVAVVVALAYYPVHLNYTSSCVRWKGDGRAFVSSAFPWPAGVQGRLLLLLLSFYEIIVRELLKTRWKGR